LDAKPLPVTVSIAEGTVGFGVTEMVAGPEVTLKPVIALFPRASVDAMVATPGPALGGTTKLVVKPPFASVAAVIATDAPDTGVKVVVTTELRAKFVPVTVTVVPGPPLAGAAASTGVTVKFPCPLTPNASIDVTVATPGPALGGTTKLVEKVPVGVAVAVIVRDAPDTGVKVVVTTELPVKPVPVTVTVEPVGPLPGVTNTVPAACATGAATSSVGRLLSSSAAVTANAAKLLRSEFKVPSSSER